MKNRLLIILFVISTVIFSCKENRKFPEVKNLSAFGFIQHLLKNLHFAPRRNLFISKG